MAAASTTGSTRESPRTGTRRQRDSKAQKTLKTLTRVKCEENMKMQSSPSPPESVEVPSCSGAVSKVDSGAVSKVDSSAMRADLRSSWREPLAETCRSL